MSVPFYLEVGWEQGPKEGWPYLHRTLRNGDAWATLALRCPSPSDIRCMEVARHCFESSMLCSFAIPFRSFHNGSPNELISILCCGKHFTSEGVLLHEIRYETRFHDYAETLVKQIQKCLKRDSIGNGRN